MLLHIVILAAGVGKRMLSNHPKVLHSLGGKPMLEWVIEAASLLHPEKIHVIYGHGGERIREVLPGMDVNWVLQKQQLGTGHAVGQALPDIPSTAHVLVLSADVPLISANTLETLIETSKERSGSTLALLVAKPENPTGLGRIVRDADGAIKAIVEEKDASDTEKRIAEIYSGICLVRAADLARWLPKIEPHNAQGEYYITDIIAMAVEDSVPIVSVTARDVAEIQGVNNRLQLATLERVLQRRLAESLALEKGVSMADLNRIDIRGKLHPGKDVFIDVNCVFEGSVILGDSCRIGPNSVLKNVTLGEGVTIHANSVLEGADVGPHCQIGPFARLRPGTRLAAHCKIGNFVETKEAVFDEDSKASHLAYLGDVTIGKDVNIGAGTITCNYDGVNKHPTVIEDGVFVGSDTQFVAPVKIGANATIGAGSTIRKDVPAGELTFTESVQKTVYGWKRPIKG